MIKGMHGMFRSSGSHAFRALLRGKLGFNATDQTVQLHQAPYKRDCD